MGTIKQRITGYWAQRMENFSALRRRELTGEKGRLWERELEQYLPAGRPQKILDAGTGIGFLAFLLAEKGHQVTGIDLTPEMIGEARRTARWLDLPVDFWVMDAENPDFACQTFDVIVSRNLTWTLPHLGAAYARWHALLKPGGMLINFDGDYCREEASVQLPDCHAHRDISAGLMLEYEQMKAELRPMQRPRPQWDVELLERAGFREVTLDTGVWRRIYREKDEFFQPTPIFTITAIA